MTISALLGVIHHELRRGEGALGLCFVFVGLIWGTLTGGLLVVEPAGQLLAATGGVGAGALLFAGREIVLAHASLGQARLRARARRC